ncbi:HAD family phosphatase [Ramlibacter sp. G-1-2-2]|uniref:HAD family phosphatase n=1 Tax=Ramlibacter agri TaxID=2728837 RepID=A0A848H287_9BURK|nr:HAD family phosphatase [Ramlibacter agri]NML44684.1 HAD family phosphatase [Ramlibacter agri]
MSAPRAFIFDMDGTMVDSMPAHARSWEWFRQRHGLDMPVDEILRRTTGRNGAECVRELLGADVPEDRAWELVGEKEAVYREIFAEEFREVAGFTAFASQARGRGLKWAVATGGDRHNLAFVLDRLHLQADADARGDMGLPGKPDPAIFLEAARRLGVPPPDCIVFEDAPFGIEAAARAGMRAVAICTTHPAAELAGKHVIAQARDFEELTKKNFLESLHA